MKQKCLAAVFLDIYRQGIVFCLDSLHLKIINPSFNIANLQTLLMPGKP
uniref:Uncharacterized protein n=1 Tax=Anguilla anguilla TaxID=7936 RepID=A0A0E9UZW3_ANGAN